MQLVVISDIFGRTPAFEALSKGLRGPSEMIDPYDGRDLQFNTEEAAYAYFTRHVGLDAHTERIKQTLEQQMDDIFIVAFSVGASCVWRLAAQALDCRIRKAVCFYGSQIRNHPHLNPEFDVELIFPQKESHFDVGELMTTLQAKNRVSCRKAPGLHGFMNKKSLNFDSGLLRFYTDYLNGQIQPKP